MNVTEHKTKRDIRAMLDRAALFCVEQRWALSTGWATRHHSQEDWDSWNAAAETLNQQSQAANLASELPMWR